MHIPPIPRRARQELGWEPKVSFRELVKMMVDADVALTAGKAPARTEIPGRLSYLGQMPYLARLACP